MKKTLLVAAASTALLISTASLAANPATQWNNKAANKTMTKIWLYATPNSKAKVINKIAANARLIPIWQKGEWVKVGNPHNGKVAWVNREQMFKARNNWNRPDIQTIYIQTTSNKNGKPTINVIAYRNGKAVTKKEAQRLYKQLRKEQKWEWSNSRRMSRWMDNAADQDLWAAQQWMNTAWNNNWDDNGPWASADWGSPMITPNALPPAGPMHTGVSGGPEKRGQRTQSNW